MVLLRSSTSPVAHSENNAPRSGDVCLTDVRSCGFAPTLWQVAKRKRVGHVRTGRGGRPNGSGVAGDSRANSVVLESSVVSQSVTSPRSTWRSRSPARSSTSSSPRPSLPMVNTPVPRVCVVGGVTCSGQRRTIGHDRSVRNQATPASDPQRKSAVISSPVSASKNALMPIPWKVSPLGPAIIGR